MNLRKINAYISLLCTAVLLDHSICHGVWMLFEFSLHKPIKSFPWILIVLMVAHAIISIALAVRGHKGTEKRKYNGYPRQNRATYIQRSSGLALFFFTVLHIVSAKGLLQLPQLVRAVLPALFFAIALTHTAISTSKALIALGIGNAKLIKAADIAIKVICCITLIADVVGFYLYLY